jgi:AcrR family transcriptional regulator
MLQVAEHLFTTRGYVSVRLRDVADALGTKHAALYYYVPGGKEQLFVVVMERSIQRHAHGIQNAIHEAGSDIRDQLIAVARWLLQQPPLNLTRLGASDFLEISPEHALRLSQLMFDALRLPLVAALEHHQANGIIALADPGLAAIAFVTLVETVHADTAPYMTDKEAIVERLIDMLLNGWLQR